MMEGMNMRRGSWRGLDSQQQADSLRVGLQGEGLAGLGVLVGTGR